MEKLSAGFARVLLNSASRGRRTRGTLGHRSIRPDFLIIGAQKCGTSSLHEYLRQHPGIAAPNDKEVHFFDLNHARGWAWYEEQFAESREDRDAGRPKRLTFESSPYYVFHPRVPVLLAAEMPDVKLILLVRDPVERAYSHYRMEVERGVEPLSFEEALEAEEDRLRGELERLEAEAGYNSLDYQRFSYAARGRYAEQLQRYLKWFPADQLLVMRSEDLGADPSGMVRKAHRFLGLEEIEPTDVSRHHVSPPSEPMSLAVKERLRTTFEPWNERLGQLLGWGRTW